MKNYKCNITIDNKTSYHLRLLKQEIPWDSFQQGPEQDLMPGTSKTAFEACGNPGPAGTEGTVVYQLGDDANKTITIYFDVPTNPFKDNVVAVDTSNPNLLAVRSGFNGKGNTEICTVRVGWVG